MIKQITLGSTGITTPQNAFGALPIQRVDHQRAVKLLHQAYKGGMTFFDTARAYSDSEEKLGMAFSNMRDKIIIATKTQAKTPEAFEKDLETSLHFLKTDTIDLYQFHCAERCYRPGDGTGMYECMQKAKADGKIRHIGITCHKIGVAEECVASGLYETMQFPLSYLSSQRDIALVQKCKEHNVGYIAMKALAGGLINNAKAAFAFISQFDNVVPIWGIQKESELSDWLAFMTNPIALDNTLKTFIEKEKEVIQGDFCRGCGYCMPCPEGIAINTVARMSLLMRRGPSSFWRTPEMQEAMKKSEDCTQCGQCRSKCPYELDTPQLLIKNYEDYKKVLSGETKVD